MKNKQFKRSLCVLLALLMVFGTLATGAFAVEDGALETQSLPFTDVNVNAWYHSYIQSVRNNGMMQGTSPTTFAPQNAFSRGEIVATLFRMHMDRRANASDPRNHPFNDVSPTAWYAPYVTWANTNGVSTGTGGARFGAHDSVPRWEIATIMHNYIRNLTELDSSSWNSAQWDAFTDLGQIPNTAAYHAFRWANNYGIINGMSATQLAPNNTANRAEAAALLTRLVRFMDEPAINIQPFLGANFNAVRHLFGNPVDVSDWDGWAGWYLFDTGINLQTNPDGTIAVISVWFHLNTSTTLAHWTGWTNHATRANALALWGTPDDALYYDVGYPFSGWIYSYWLPDATLIFYFDSYDRLWAVYYWAHTPAFGALSQTRTP